jgi:hypothetical protein
MTSSELRALIQTTLKPHNLWSPSAEELLMATAANESHLGEFRTQIDGPARGIFQEEQEDLTDLYTNWLHFHPELLDIVEAMQRQPNVDDLIDNDPLAICVCRLHYYRYPDALPAPDDIEGIWKLYKLRYNTPEGAATQQGFMQCYAKYVGNPCLPSVLTSV